MSTLKTCKDCRWCVEVHYSRGHYQCWLPQMYGKDSITQDQEACTAFRGIEITKLERKKDE